jgi:dihydroorotase
VNIFFEKIRVINPLQELDEIMYLWLKDGIIQHLSLEPIAIDAETEIISGERLACSPGFLDMHVHLREPGQEYKEDILSGSNAAANGGFTGVVAMPNTIPAVDNAIVVEYIKGKSKGLLTDVYISAALTQNREGKHISSMLELDEAGVKLFTDDGGVVTSTETMRRIFDYAATRDILISQHCEDTFLSSGFAMNEGYFSDKLGLKGYPSVAEEIIIARDIMLSEYCGNRRYHVSHISTKGAVRIIRDAKQRGLRVSCEATPHHFSISEELLTSYNTNLKMNPPLRSKEDIEAILEGLSDGTIDCIASDHAPHALHEKDVEFEIAPYGIVGLETTLGLSMTNLVHTGILTMNQLIDKLSINPRKLLKLPEIFFELGNKANITIFAPDEEWVVDQEAFRSKSKNTPFNGYRLKGKPKYTINNNQIYRCEL